MSQPGTPRSGAPRALSSEAPAWRPPGRRGVRNAAVQGGAGTPRAAGSRMRGEEIVEPPQHRRPAWRVTGAELGEANRVMALSRARGLVVSSRGTNTDNDGLEEEVAQLKARIKILMKAGTDYRQQVDELFLSTKEETKAELSEKDAEIARLQEDLEAASLESARLRTRAADMGTALEEAQEEIVLSRAEAEAEKERMEQAMAAQRRVEEELDNAGRQQEEERREVEEEMNAGRGRERELVEVINDLNEKLREAAGREHALGEELHARTDQLGQAGEQLVTLEERARDAERKKREMEGIGRQRDGVMKECERLRELVAALQHRQQELETELQAARKKGEDGAGTQIALVRAEAERDQLTADRSAASDRCRKLEEQNRLLLRQSDRRKQEAAELSQRLADALAEAQKLRSIVSEATADESLQAAVASLPASAPSANVRMRDAAVECRVEDPQEQSSCELFSLRKETLGLQEEKRLLLDERAHERAQDLTVRQLCEELSSEVGRLSADNQTLREGLAMIEDSFGRFIPQDMRDALPPPPTPQELAPLPGHFELAPQGKTGQSLLSSRDVFTQTLSTDDRTRDVVRIESVGEDGVVWDPGAKMGVSRDAWHRLDVLEQELQSAWQQQKVLQEAAAAAFRQSTLKLLTQLGEGHSPPPSVLVEVLWMPEPARAGAQTPRAAAESAVQSHLLSQQSAVQTHQSVAQSGRPPPTPPISRSSPQPSPLPSVAQA
eukprot:Hpha_TRINITY_DN12192_c0_g1::TRINITY_DN12192_c0_g1_i1::g.82154::m.82154